MPFCKRSSFAAAVLALFLVTTPARAQMLIGYLFGEKLASPTFNMGFEIGVNFSKLDGLEGAERLNRTVFGLFGDWRFSKHFHLTGAFLPAAGRGAQGHHPHPHRRPGHRRPDGRRHHEAEPELHRVPPAAEMGAEAGEGFRIGAGPSFGIITGANDRYEATTAAGTPYVLERDIGDQIPGLDFGLSVDVEWRFKMLSIAGRYTHGLTDIEQTGFGRRRSTPASSPAPAGSTWARRNPRQSPTRQRLVPSGRPGTGPGVLPLPGRGESPGAYRRPVPPGALRPHPDGGDRVRHAGDHGHDRRPARRAPLSGYRRQAIVQPIYIVATPRSGTTFLHRLMCLDERFTWLKLYQTLLPSALLMKGMQLLSTLDRRIGSSLHRLNQRASSRRSTAGRGFTTPGSTGRKRTRWCGSSPCSLPVWS